MSSSSNSTLSQPKFHQPAIPKLRYSSKNATHPPYTIYGMRIPARIIFIPSQIKSQSLNALFYVTLYSRHTPHAVSSSYIMHFGMTTFSVNNLKQIYYHISSSRCSYFCTIASCRHSTLTNFQLCRRLLISSFGSVFSNSSCLIRFIT